MTAPDPTIARDLRAIDAGLSAVLVETPRGERWAIFDDLQIDGNPEATADLMARELQAALLANGKVVSLAECQVRCWEKLRDAKLVCYVTEEDGSYRPLDARIVQKLQRMDYYRRNVGLRDWMQMLQVKADLLAEQRRRAGDDLWDCYRNDRVFQHCLSNVLWGVRQDMHYTGGDSENHLSVADEHHGECGRAEALGDGGRRDPLPAHHEGDRARGAERPV